MLMLLFTFFAWGLELEVPVAQQWWLKTEVQTKTRDQRQIMVVIKEDEKLGKGYYSMTGTGVLRATPAFTVKKILDFDALPKVSTYFKKVTHQPELSRVYLVLEAYGYEARMLIKYKVELLAEKQVFHWSVVWGGFEGMTGRIELASLKSEKTEAILLAQFNDKEIPLPNIFKSFILEVIVQQVAKSIRSYIEEQYVLSKGKI